MIVNVPTVNVLLINLIPGRHFEISKQPFRASHLHQSHSSHQDDQRDPLVDAQLAAQHGDGEQSRGQDLQLVRHLMDGKSKSSTTILPLVVIIIKMTVLAAKAFTRSHLSCTLSKMSTSCDNTPVQCTW